MKEQIVELVKNLGGGLNELVFTFTLPNVAEINSIEVYNENKIRLNRWCIIDGEEAEMQFDFDELRQEEQSFVLELLKSM